MNSFFTSIKNEGELKLKKMKKNIVLTLLATITLFIPIMKPVMAEEGDNGANNVSVSTNIPENQIDKNQTYFDLLMEPGKEQELEVVLRNNTDKEVTMLADVNTAITNDNGVVDYSWNVASGLEQAKINNKDEANTKIDLKSIGYDSTLKQPLSEMASIDKEIKIPAKSQVTVKVKVKMPDEQIDGVIAGGIYLTQKEDTASEEGKSQGVQIKNKFVYVVGIQIRQNADISALVPDMKLDPKKIVPTQINHRNYLGINLQNIEPVFIRKLTVDAKVYKKGSAEVLHEATQEGMKMAPNSNFNFGVNWENQEFKAGDYRVKVTAKAEDYNKEWSWDEEFTITKDKADEMNAKAIELEKSEIAWWVYALIGIGLLLLVLLIAYLIKRHIDKKKKEEELKRKRALARKRKKKNAAASHKKNEQTRKKD
ncbi:cell surface protein [Carnobacterium maltaromaticum]|nr:cell surface protein [Carnobacterium maltaromaticum]PLS33653.1 cell surface protein [Carnobacterium maltaromaticum]PLS33973.1 cell surface protein [Carnobacterium maltaromaticum]PLS41312.1 cell surface protein [Carnobacterium maltaromaticum]PLS42234.1 cell surface protein [Carnobacterium maltaromaticum]